MRSEIEVLEPERTALPRRQLLALFSGLMLSILLAALDSTIVATALPTIVSELGGLDRLSWVVTAYLLAQTVVIPLYGKLGDLYGRKVVLQSAILIFLGGSALCGLSESMTALIVFRALQGLGGGGLMVTAQAVIGDVVSPRERGRYQGILGAAFGVSSVAGPLLGGFFTTHLSWQWIFYINLPLGAAALFVIAATLPRAVLRRRHAIDYTGAALLAVCLSAIVLVTDLGGLSYAWTSAPIVTLAILAVASLGLFIAAERRAREPILPLRLFRDRTFVVVSLVGFSGGFVLFGSVTYLPMFLQVVKGSSPTVSGLQMVPMMAGTLVTSILAGQAISRFGRYRAFPIAGMATATCGLLLLSRIDANTDMRVMLGYLLVLGAGLGLVTQVLIVAVQNAAAFEDLGVATSGVTLFRLIGGSVGTAVLGTIFAVNVSSTLSSALPAAGAGQTVRELSAQTIARLAPHERAIYIDAITSSLGTLFLFAAVVGVVGFLLSWFVPEKPLRETVAARASSVGDEAGEVFPKPAPPDPTAELLRGLSILASRDVRRAYLQSLVNEAGVQLMPISAWLLLRLHDTPAKPIAELEGVAGVPRERVEMGLQELLDRGCITPADSAAGTYKLTREGCEVYDRLARVRRERIQRIQSEWPPEERRLLADVLRRLAGELAPPHSV